MSFFEVFAAYERWTAEEEARLTSAKERFPVGSVHTFTASYPGAQELVFLVLDGAYLRKYQQLGSYGQSVGFPSTMVNVPYLNLIEGKRGSFCATSDIDKQSVRIA